MFAAVLLDSGNVPYYINLKLEPAEGEFYRQQYEDVIPGYYSNKAHWNSIRPDGAVPDELLREMLDKSYGLGGPAPGRVLLGAGRVSIFAAKGQFSLVVLSPAPVLTFPPRVAIIILILLQGQKQGRSSPAPAGRGLLFCPGA